MEFGGAPEVRPGGGGHGGDRQWCPARAGTVPFRDVTSALIGGGTVCGDGGCPEGLGKLRRLVPRRSDSIWQISGGLSDRNVLHPDPPAGRLLGDIPYYGPTRFALCCCASSRQSESRNASVINSKELWIWTGAIFIISFSILGYLGREIYVQAPPVPTRSAPRRLHSSTPGTISRRAVKSGRRWAGCSSARYGVTAAMSLRIGALAER